MPLYIEMGINRKTKKPNRYHINLNNYHNWHFQVRNKLKIEYQSIMSKRLPDIKFANNIVINLILHRKDKRCVDRANILSIHEKFFCDGLTQNGCIKDDNDEFLHSTHYYTGAIDKENPRVDIQILEIPHNLVPFTIRVPHAAQDISKLEAPINLVYEGV